MFGRHCRRLKGLGTNALTLSILCFYPIHNGEVFYTRGFIWNLIIDGG